MHAKNPLYLQIGLVRLLSNSYKTVEILQQDQPQQQIMHNFDLENMYFCAGFWWIFFYWSDKNETLQICNSCGLLLSNHDIFKSLFCCLGGCDVNIFLEVKIDNVQRKLFSYLSLNPYTIIIPILLWNPRQYSFEKLEV